MDFERDENERHLNIAEHGLDCLRAAAAFDGRAFVEFRSRHPEEQRLLRVFLLDAISDRHTDTARRRARSYQIGKEGPQ